MDAENPWNTRPLRRRDAHSEAVLANLEHAPAYDICKMLANVRGISSSLPDGTKADVPIIAACRLKHLTPLAQRHAKSIRSFV
jgi:hypothetical protein